MPSLYAVMSEDQDRMRDEIHALREENRQLKCDLQSLQLQDEDRKAYQRMLENKISRLKDRIKVLEK